MRAPIRPIRQRVARQPKESVMRAMRVCGIALVALGCGKAADKPAEGSMAEAPPAEAGPAPAGISLADVAGTWKIRSTVEGNEKRTITYDLVATADRSGWSIKFPDRDPIPTRVVAVEGDSIVTESGPFESVLRKGVQVNSRVVLRLQDGKLVGTTTARYQVSGPDTLARLSLEGTRAP
jgi:hypothetical protein